MFVPVILNADDEAVLNIDEHGVEAEPWFRGTAVFGLFCSSSSAMKVMAARNGLNRCNTSSSWARCDRGGNTFLWKHSVPISPYDFGDSDVFCVCTVRNPVEWLISLAAAGWHTMHPHGSKKRPWLDCSWHRKGVVLRCFNFANQIPPK